MVDEIFVAMSSHRIFVFQPLHLAIFGCISPSVDVARLQPFLLFFSGHDLVMFWVIFLPMHVRLVVGVGRVVEPKEANAY